MRKTELEFMEWLEKALCGDLKYGALVPYAGDDITDVNRQLYVITNISVYVMDDPFHGGWRILNSKRHVKLWSVMLKCAEAEAKK